MIGYEAPANYGFSRRRSGAGITNRCPQKAISLLRDPAKGESLEIQRLFAESATVSPCP